MLKGLNDRRLKKSLGVKGLIHSAKVKHFEKSDNFFLFFLLVFYPKIKRLRYTKDIHSALRDLNLRWWEYACNETKLMHYLSLVSSVTVSLHVSGLLVAHHKVAMFIRNNLVRVVHLFDCRRAMGFMSSRHIQLTTTQCPTCTQNSFTLLQILEKGWIFKGTYKNRPPTIA
jgi:hypothetical protein